MFTRKMVSWAVALFLVCIYPSHAASRAVGSSILQAIVVQMNQWARSDFPPEPILETMKLIERAKAEGIDERSPSHFTLEVDQLGVEYGTGVASSSSLLFRASHFQVKNGNRVISIHFVSPTRFTAFGVYTREFRVRLLYREDVQQLRLGLELPRIQRDKKWNGNWVKDFERAFVFHRGEKVLEDWTRDYKLVATGCSRFIE